MSILNIKDDGCGKGEVLIAFLYEGCKISGGSESFDALLKNGSKHELKSLAIWATFRAGTKGSISKQEFYKNITRSRDVLKTLIDQIGKNTFKNLVSPELYALSMQILERGDYRKNRGSISSAIDIAELNPTRLDLIELWFYLAYVETSNFNREYEIRQNVFTNEYEVEDDDLTKLINVLRSLKYVINPLKFQIDIKTSIQNWFKGIDSLIIFNEKEKFTSVVTDPEELVLEMISQNGLKVKEKRCSKNTINYAEKTFDLWKKDNSLNFYELYSKLLNSC